MRWCRTGGFIGRPYDESVTIDDLAAGKSISLATFKRDGSRVATPVWVTRDGDHLYVITDPNSGKAKRLRNSARAEVAPAMRGKDQLRLRARVCGPAGRGRDQKVKDLVNAEVRAGGQRHPTDGQTAQRRGPRQQSTGGHRDHAGVRQRIIPAGCSPSAGPPGGPVHRRRTDPPSAVPRRCRRRYPHR